MIDYIVFIVEHPQADLVLAAGLVVVVLLLSLTLYRRNNHTTIDVSIKLTDKEEEEDD